MKSVSFLVFPKHLTITYIRRSRFLYQNSKVLLMVKKDLHSGVGISSIILGILGLVLYFIGWFFYSFADNRLYGMVIGVIFGILAVILGYIAKKQGDTYGTYGIYLGALVIIIALITLLLTTVTSVETGYY